MTIGIPRAMLYYRYKVLWKTFFNELNCNVVVSKETNKKILNDGIKFSVDECCLSSKIYMGHVFSLVEKCDYILIPRVASYGKNNDVCVKFNALYDIVNNTFKGLNLLDYNIDFKNGDSELKGFLKMGKTLGYSFIKTLMAYRKAKKAQLLNDKQNIDYQNRMLNRSDTLKILIVSHPYNTYDKLIGYPVIEHLKKLDAQPIFADRVNKKECIKEAKKMSHSLYWIYNKELIGSISLLEDKIDGVILLTSFPCGPDSLVNDLIMRKSKKVPTINIILDELQGEAGMQTRIESFIDIIKEKDTDKITA